MKGYNTTGNHRITRSCIPDLFYVGNEQQNWNSSSESGCHL